LGKVQIARLDGTQRAKVKMGPLASTCEEAKTVPPKQMVWGFAPKMKKPWFLTLVFGPVEVYAQKLEFFGIGKEYLRDIPNEDNFPVLTGI